jgi:hypothetical protein
MIDLDLCLSASVNVRYILHTQQLRLYNTDLVWESLYPFFVSIYPCWIILLKHLLISLHAILSPSLVFLFLSHLPLLFRWEKTESATLMTIATRTSSHHVPGSCRPCILNFWRPWCTGNKSIKRCHQQKEDPYQKRRSMMLARLWTDKLRSNSTP